QVAARPELDPAPPVRHVAVRTGVAGARRAADRIADPQVARAARRFVQIREPPLTVLVELAPLLFREVLQQELDEVGHPGDARATWGQGISTPLSSATISSLPQAPVPGPGRSCGGDPAGRR